MIILCVSFVELSINRTKTMTSIENRKKKKIIIKEKKEE